MKKSIKIQLFLILIPVFFSIVAAIQSNIFLALLSIIIMFVLVFRLPIAKNSENLWTFLLSAAILSPLNVRFIINFKDKLCIFYDSKYIVFLSSIIIFFLLLSIEELILGVITRSIKPYQFNFDD